MQQRLRPRPLAWLLRALVHIVAAAAAAVAAAAPARLGQLCQPRVRAPAKARLGAGAAGRARTPRPRRHVDGEPRAVLARLLERGGGLGGDALGLAVNEGVLGAGRADDRVVVERAVHAGLAEQAAQDVVVAASAIVAGAVCGDRGVVVRRGVVLAPRCLHVDAGKQVARLGRRALLIQRKQLLHVVALEEAPLLRVLENLVGEELLEDLAVVDLLLDRARGHEPVHGHIALLPVAPRALAGLDVCGRVPVGVKNEHAVRARQVHAQAAHARRQQERKHVLVAVKLVNQAQARADRGHAVHAQEPHAEPLDGALEDVEHLPRLAEQQRAMPLGVPHRQQRFNNLELAGPLRVAVVVVGRGRLTLE
eukprot:Unigene10038_Nuclearia_a/m.30667 Unigene10038_Nuclearia_a/g.30667  ORF Unigene10038_Nuclearia_a/g.30667 Unigene10038_Nuclearia_a/m.30667 type:complete len:365 (-) Unigene10038_Nuclearia_a:805-1899(-)